MEESGDLRIGGFIMKMEREYARLDVGFYSRTGGNGYLENRGNE